MKNKCMHGYIMNAHGSCIPKKNKNVIRSRKINSIRNKKPFKGYQEFGESRTVPACCYDPGARYECRFTCEPAGYFNSWGQWQWSAGLYDFVITEVMSSCPTGASPVMVADMCLARLEHYQHVYGTCEEQVNPASGYGTTSGNCSCTAYLQYDCPGQSQVDCEVAGNCGPPKQEFMRGGSIKRNRRKRR